MKQVKVAILGATGAVGQEMMKILAERKFPIEELHLLASEHSVENIIIALQHITLIRIQSGLALILKMLNMQHF